MLMFLAEYIYRKSFYSLMFALMLSSCEWRPDFGITAKTHNNFTKDDAEKYNYILDEDSIKWQDKNGEELLLTPDEKDTIVTSVNQCLTEAGYLHDDNDDDDETTKKILLNLDFTENETKDAEIYYQNEMIKRYRGMYNFDFEPYIGPKNKTFIIFNEGDGLKSSFINYSGKDKVYFIGLPNYSKFGGLSSSLISDHSSLSVKCKQREGLFCNWGTADLFNSYAKLSGKEGDMTKFDITLHYKINMPKSERSIKKTRGRMINHFIKYICLFIGDNLNDIQIIPNEDEELYYDLTRANLARGSGEYQLLKNKLNMNRKNNYTIINKTTDKKLNNISVGFSGYNGDSDLYGEKFDKIYWFRLSCGQNCARNYYLPFYHLKYPISQLEIKNNYSK